MFSINLCRVQCYGAATIIEVQYKEEVIKEEPEDNGVEKEKESELDALKKKKKEVEKKKSVLEERLSVFMKEKDYLVGYGNRLTGSNSVSYGTLKCVNLNSLTQ